MIRSIPFFIFLFGLTSLCHAQQTITLKNPSFEDQPRQGKYQKSSGNFTILDNRNTIKGWSDCGKVDFPLESAPDIHSSTTEYWGVKQAPSHGETFLSLSVRDNDSWESVSQGLDTTLQKGKCYALTVDLSQSEYFLSGSRLDKEPQKEHNYSKPIVLQIWGGYANCNADFLLYTSSAVDHKDWQTYDVSLAPADDYTHLTFQAFYKTPVMFPYNGHILVDNISEIVEVECVE